MINRRYRKYLLVSSFVIAILIFSSGLFVGYSLDTFKVNDILSATQQNELSTESYLTELQFIDVFGGNKCSLLVSRVDEIKTVLGETRTKLAKYGVSFAKKQDFDYLKRKHVISQIRFMLLIEGLNTECGADYDTILFFYEIDQQSSSNQGYALDKLGGQNDKLVVLSFDLNYKDEALTDLLATKYDIESTPQIVINEKTLESGFVSEEELKNYLA